MILLTVLTVLHMLLVVLAVIACKEAKEKEWVIVWVLCLIPIIGPLLIMYLYIMSKVNEQASKLKDNSEEFV